MSSSRAHRSLPCHPSSTILPSTAIGRPEARVVFVTCRFRWITRGRPRCGARTSSGRGGGASCRRSDRHPDPVCRHPSSRRRARRWPVDGAGTRGVEERTVTVVGRRTPPVDTDGAGRKMAGLVAGRSGEPASGEETCWRGPARAAGCGEPPERRAAAGRRRKSAGRPAGIRSLPLDPQIPSPSAARPCFLSLSRSVERLSPSRRAACVRLPPASASAWRNRFDSRQATTSV